MNISHAARNCNVNIALYCLTTASEAEQVPPTALPIVPDQILSQTCSQVSFTAGQHLSSYVEDDLSLQSLSGSILRCTRPSRDWGGLSQSHVGAKKVELGSELQAVTLESSIVFC